MRIGIDMMGGDFAPLETTLGVIQARKELDPRYTLVLIGNEPEIRDIIRQHGGNESDFVFVHTDEVIGMAEHPTKSFQQKPKSSIPVGFHLLKEKKIAAPEKQTTIVRQLKKNVQPIIILPTSIYQSLPPLQ